VFFLYLSQSAVMILAGIVPLYALKLRMRDLVEVRTDVGPRNHVR
jgi:hypothetical protein